MNGQFGWTVVLRGGLFAMFGEDSGLAKDVRDTHLGRWYDHLFAGLDYSTENLVFKKLSRPFT